MSSCYCFYASAPCYRQNVRKPNIPESNLIINETKHEWKTIFRTCPDPEIDILILKVPSNAYVFKIVLSLELLYHGQRKRIIPNLIRHVTFIRSIHSSSSAHYSGSGLRAANPFNVNNQFSWKHKMQKRN